MFKDNASKKRKRATKSPTKTTGDGILHADGSFTYEAHSEASLSEQTARYLRMTYPDVPFNIDVLAGINLTAQQGVRAKNQGKTKSWPDLFIAVPRHGFNGLFIEQKKDGQRIYQVKNPHKFANTHVAAQSEMLDKLRQNGYFAAFAIGFKQTRELIDWYLTGDEEF